VTGSPAADATTSARLGPPGGPRGGDAGGKRIVGYALLGVLLVLAYGAWAHALGPSEDAAILYLFSENLAHTGVISYWTGGPPAEGATDFLWMVALAGLHRVGIDTHAAAAGLSALAHLATAALLQLMSGRRDRRVFLCAGFGLFLLPAAFAALLGFSVLVFGVVVLATAVCFVERRSRALAATALVACLVRPDGALFVLPLLAAFLALERGRRTAVLRDQVLLFALPGLAYFAWLAWYFGHWFPLPFYVKSGTERWLGVLELDSARMNLRFAALLAPVLLVALWRLPRATRERADVLVLAAALVLVPLAVYATFQLSQNVGERFQYPIVLAALALPLVRRARPPALGRAHAAAVALTLVLGAPSYALGLFATLLVPLQTAPELARDLGAIDRGLDSLDRDGRAGCTRTMAVTEAGRLPYYSGWVGIDLWGLSTPAFAREVVTPEALARLEPDLISLHASTRLYRTLIERGADVEPGRAHVWNDMVRNAWIMAVRGGYELLMVPYARDHADEPFHARIVPVALRLFPALDVTRRHDMFLVAPGSPCRDELLRVLRAHGGVGIDEYRRRQLER
jgi:hypothetical protein